MGTTDRALASSKVQAADLARLETRLRQLENELSHTQRLASLGMLVGIIAHEVNNLLTPVLSYSQLALQHRDDQELSRKALERAADGAEKVAAIASSVLAMAKKDGFASPSSPPAQANVKRCLDEALRCLVMAPGRDGIELTLEVDPDLEAAIDPVALQHVFVNLLLNARAAMKTVQRRHLSVSCSTRNSNAAIQIDDTGHGIEPSLLSRAFDPFVSSREREPPGQTTTGTGLGLAICRRLVEACGGSITAKSIVGEGTSFEITLPSVSSTDRSTH